MFFAKNPIFLFQSKKAQSDTAPGSFVCMYISYYNVRGGYYVRGGYCHRK
ncbi:hypothetical protein FAEPRAA2165_02520 [Faecalibacterium duncaniae]|uniref:Uncharacterized protein n=1 Tax=Faecalibacterium duncaniae (strain DSM 17677 / JCM 31915 / A2-165) TaxID=411483 RepID=C7H881_FAED2|nr:hypothetical protein FAEPRAA2165_02520 [Faecalibacterium duncaniae]